MIDSENLLWGKLFMKNFDKLNDLNLKPIHYQLIIYLMGKAEHKNRIDIDTQASVAKSMGFNKDYISKCFRDLQKCNVIIRFKRNYHFNTNLFNISNTKNPIFNKPLVKCKIKKKSKQTTKTIPETVAADSLDDLPASFMIN